MIYFTSDHHFNHANIIRYCNRPFQSVEEMNDVMVRRWNERVQAGDIVYYLGDFSLGIKQVEEFAPRLNGEKHLIVGNHDLCHPMHKKKAQRAQPIYEAAGFKTLQREMTLEIAGQSVLLHHFPYLSDQRVALTEYEVKYKEERPIDRGRWLLHGHIHEKWKQSERMINVGVDAWDFYPVSMCEIEKIISAQSN